MRADSTLDCFGLLKTAAKMKELEPGQVLEIVSTDEGIKEDMPAWCKATGHEFLGVEQDGDLYKVYVRKR